MPFINILLLYYIAKIHYQILLPHPLNQIPVSRADQTFEFLNLIYSSDVYIDIPTHNANTHCIV